MAPFEKPHRFGDEILDENKSVDSFWTFGTMAFDVVSTTADHSKCIFDEIIKSFN